MQKTSSFRRRLPLVLLVPLLWAAVLVPTVARAEGSVTFDKSRGNAASETVAFDEGAQLGTRGLYDTGSWIFKRYFLGRCKTDSWDGGDGLCFATQTFGDVFPEGVTGNETLYAVYAGASELAGINEAGKVDICKEQAANQVIPNCTLLQSSGFDAIDAEKAATFYYNRATTPTGFRSAQASRSAPRPRT